jgi:hypothetical protein
MFHRAASGGFVMSGSGVTGEALSAGNDDEPVTMKS